ncbi:hypothetical protein Ahy_B08g089368 [Arachis hypogaea]|uniref:K Homology domain-containing protein n=1 Tax=Arachis hypogaea TaxID=3818 RepID=A0A444XXE8_ARAHY|nr:hypothetical protein Ahy_B08g089368 [Arachis hypogaea]
MCTTIWMVSRTCELLPKSKKEVETGKLASPPPPQELPPSVALRHYHRRLVVRASSSFKNRSFFFLELGASVPGISSAPSRSCRRPSGAQSPSSSSGRRRFFQLKPSSELCSSPGLCLRHDSAPSSQTAQKKNPSPFQFPSFEFREQKLNQEKNLRLRRSLSASHYRFSTQLELTFTRQYYSAEKPTYVRFLVSNSAAGSVIGKGGSTITDFQSQSGARIQLSHNHEFFPGTTDRIIMLQSEDENDPEPKTKVRLIVPNGSCGGIIGKGGATISDAQTLLEKEEENTNSNILPTSVDRTEISPSQGEYEDLERVLSRDLSGLDLSDQNNEVTDENSFTFNPSQLTGKIYAPCSDLCSWFFIVLADIDLYKVILFLSFCNFL